MVRTDCVCSGAQRAPCEGPFNRARALVHRGTPLTCHSEERSDVGISCRQLRFRRECPVIRPGTARLHPKGTSSRFALRAPRRFAPRNDTSGSAAVHQCPPAVEWLCTRRSLTAATVKFGSACGRRWFVRAVSAFPRLHPKGTSSRFALRAPRPLWGLAMTIRNPCMFGDAAQQPVTAKGAY